MQLLVNGDTSAPSNSAVRYNTIYGAGRSGWQSDKTYTTVPMPCSGRFTYLHVGGPDPGAGKTRTFAIHINGVDSALSVQLTNGNPVVASYNSVAFSKGDLVCISATPSGSPTNGSFEWNIGIESDVQGETFIFPSSGSGVVLASSGRYISMNGDTSGDTATEFDASLLMPMSGTFTGIYGYQIDPPGAGDSRIYTVVKNGVDTAMTFTISGASDTTGEDLTNSFTVAKGDRIALRIDEGGATTNTRIKCGVIFKPDDPSLFICSGGSPTNMTVGPFHNHNVTGFALSPSTVSLTNFIRPSPRWIAVENHVMLDVAPGVGNNRSFRSYNFLAQPGFLVTITDTNTYGSATGALVGGYNFLGVPISNTQIYIEMRASATVATASAIWSYACRDRLPSQATVE